MRKTKIICTIGPSSSDKETIIGMCKAGMNVARLNFSHSNYEEHKKRIDLIKEVRAELGMPIALMLDTKGPEYRIKTFKNHKVLLENGHNFILTTEDIIGDDKRVSVNYKALPHELEAGDRVLLNDGLLELEVKNTTETEVVCTVVEGGELSDRKSMSFPNKVLKQVYLSEQDKNDLLFGIENDFDFVACSFVSSRQDLIDVKKFLCEHGGENIDILAKIENRDGVNNIEEICKECEGIMIARGDMGVEIPFEELPTIQKQLITKCRLLGKRVITATEMLESMINKSRPTRAEISDVANAVYDGTSAIMLSGETAAGKYPVLTVKTMSRIAEQTENSIHYDKRFLKAEFNIKNTVDAISHATCGMSIDIHAKAIAVCSLSGTTVRMVSRFRPPVDIIGVTIDEKTWRKLALSWGVIPAMCEIYESSDVLFFTAKNITVNKLKLQKDDKIIITGGTTNGTSGKTNMIRIETV